MRYAVCKDCADRELHCKSWCERWKQEKKENERERKLIEKDKMLNGAFVEMGKSRDRRFRK